MAERVGQHAHCHMCGKAIPVNEILCSEECKQKYQDMIKKRKILIYVLYAAIFFTIIVLVISYMQ